MPQHPRWAAQKLGGLLSVCDISAPTVVKIGRGRLATVTVTAAGTTAGAAYDASATGDTSRLIAVIPNTMGIHELNWPCSKGIVIVPGTGQVVAVAYL